MTLPYFPEILPDELLYSVLARHHRHTGSTGAHRTAVALFGESPSRAVVTVDPARWPELARLAAAQRVACRRLGTVGGERLRITLHGVGATGAAEERGAGVADELDVPLSELRKAWTHALPRALGEG